MNLVATTHPALWTPARLLTAEDRTMHRHTFDELRALMQRLNGAGLALPQVGVELRAFVSRYDAFPLAINPTWSPVGDQFISKLEGCLSRPGWHTYVRRPARIHAAWEDAEGVRHTAVLESIEARVYQHECDHLDGRPIFPAPPGVIPNHMSSCE